jgi:hypothetical protein
MSVSFFRGLEPVVGALLLVVVVVVGVVLVWLWFSGFLGKAASSAELAPDVLKIEGGYITNVADGVKVFLWIRNLGGSAVLPRTVYVYNGDVVCFADGLPWVVGPGRLEYLDVWMPVGPPSVIGSGVVAGCREAVVPGVVYVVKLVTARGAEVSVVFTAN